MTTLLVAAAEGSTGMDWTLVLVAVISLFGGGAIVQLLRLRADRAKILSEAKLADAQTAQVISEAAERTIRSISEYGDKRIKELEAQIAKLETSYQSKIAVLQEQITELTRDNIRLRQRLGEHQ